MYGFGDASGTGFGRTFATPVGTMFCHGVYGKYTSKRYRELANLVSALEQGTEEGTFKNSEVWIFTNNSMAEAVFCKGHSSSPGLNHLALRLQKLEMDGVTKVHMVHVTGT